jgi:valyl-tRNA synthetase
VAQGQQLTNKLWNASRLILLGVGSVARAAAAPTAVEDRWILSRLERTQVEVSSRIERYDFSHAALTLYDYVFGELCDWYLELVKPRLRSADPQLAATLLHVLTETLTLAHPLIPFVTEEIWGNVPGAEGLLAARRAASGGLPDSGAEESIARVIEAVQAVGGWRDYAGVRAGTRLSARLSADGYDETAAQLERLTKLSFSSDGADPVASVPVPGGAVEILPSEGLDLGAVQRKRDAERARLEHEIAIRERKLGNSGFVEKAPPAVVQKTRDELERLRAELEGL